MKRTAFIALFCFVALIFSTGMATAVAVDNILICHNPGPNQVTISVDNNAVYDAHLAHGDTIGACGGAGGGTCSEGQTFLSCSGTPDVCSSYGASDTCSAAGCSWTSTPITTTQFSDPFSDIDNYWDNNNNDPYSDESSDSNCIPVNPGTGTCLQIDEGGSNGNSEYLVKDTAVDMSACSAGTGLFKITSVKESDTLESDDCVYVRFSNDNGATWSASRTTIFCDDNPSSPFQTSIGDSYLTSQFLVRFEKNGFTGNGEAGYLDGINISCGIPVSSCTGSPSACGTYSDDDACFGAGCDVVCRDLTYCGDGVTQNPNDDQVAEECDDGNQVNDDACSNTCVANVCGDGVVNNGETCDDGANNGVACEPGYNDVCDYCTSECDTARVVGGYCGDDIVNGQEACEVGDQVADPEHYSCNAQTCQLDYVPYCGDGATDQGEECDYGDQNGVACDPAYGSSCDYCEVDCSLWTSYGGYCGDGQVTDGETCDGDAPKHYTCEQCLLVYQPYCGDGNVDQGEACDDGNSENGDGCSGTCETEEACTDGQVLAACTGEPNACDGYTDSQSCTFAGCDWSASQGQDDVTQWSESFASPASDWAVYASIGNGISHITNDNSNCINDGNDDCIKFNGDGTPAASNLSKQSDIDLSACSAGSATFRIAKIKEYGELESDDCAYAWFSSDGGATWGDRTLIFCNDNPSSTYTTGVPDAYLTTQMRIRMERINFGGDLERVYFDGFSVTCDLPGESSCGGDPTACSEYDDIQACAAAGCDTVCRDRTYCGDGTVQAPNDEQVVEECEVEDQIPDPEHQTCNPQTCQYDDQPYCGDGQVNNDGEQCDDGNNADGDGCNANCGIEQVLCDPEQELILNGGFEAPEVTHGSGWDIFADGTSGLEWSVEWAGAYDGAPDVANAELHGGVNGWVPSEGQQYTELDSDWNGHDEGPNGEQSSVRIYQDIATTPGETYHIRFQFSPRPSTDISQNVLEFYWDGVLQDTISAAGGGNTAWSVHEYDLVATGTTTRVAFEDAGTPNSEGTFLDDVSVLCAPREEEFCPYEVVSDTHTGLAAGGNALLVAEPYHPAWTASVPGALWVWDGSGVGVVNFTDSVVITGPVSDANLRIASDNSYRVWINGVLVGSDAEEFNYASGHEEDYDVTSYLGAGANTFLFEVDNWHGPGGLMYRLTYTDVCEQPGEYCGDGVVNQEGEECDLEDGVIPGYECSKDCTLRMTCEEAIRQGLLTGEIVDGTAVVQNDAEDGFVVSLASYEMYAPLIEDQVLYDSDTQFVEGNSGAEFSVDLPACAYQIDLICGEPKQENPDYTEEEKLDFEFGNQDQPFCVPDDEGDASLIVLEGFPQCNNFVFECQVEGFEPTSYSWYFGDGQFLPNSQESSIWHTFPPGAWYNVSCTATDGEHYAASSIEVYAETCCGDGVVQELNDQEIAEQCDGSAPDQYTCDESCQLHLTCEGAIQQGLLTGSVDDEGNALVQNDADEDYLVSLASYEMYALLIEDQVLFDSTSTVVEAGTSEELSVELPACMYQLDLVCGEPLPFVPLYGDRVIAFTFGDGEFCIPDQRENEAIVTVDIEDGFPQSEQGAEHYVFTCDVEGFEPTSYYWYFGDGEILPGVSESSVWHTYTENGDFVVACTATDGDQWQTGTLGISVESIVDPSVELSVDPWYPQGADYVFLCDAEGFTPTSYDWDFGDGQLEYDLLVPDVYHTFGANGQYTVTCTATDGVTTETDTLEVQVDQCGEFIVDITSVEPIEGGYEVLGTLYSVENPEADLSGEIVTLNDMELGVLFNDWSALLEAQEEPFLLTAVYENACGQVTSAEFLVGDDEPQGGGDGPEVLFLQQEVNQEVAGSGGGDCAQGWHNEGGACVKNAAVQEIGGDGTSDGGSYEPLAVPDEPLPSDDGTQDGDDDQGNDLLTGAVIGGGIGSLTWLFVLLAVIGLLFGGYLWSKE